MLVPMKRECRKSKVEYLAFRDGKEGEDSISKAYFGVLVFFI